MGPQTSWSHMSIAHIQFHVSRDREEFLVYQDELCALKLVGGQFIDHAVKIVEEFPVLSFAHVLHCRIENKQRWKSCTLTGGQTMRLAGHRGGVVARACVVWLHAIHLNARDNTQMSIEPKTLNVMAGFWRRLGAFFVDGLVLGAIGWVAGLFLAEQFVHMGPWGRLLGFCVALPYFGLLNSGVGDGQTLGKRLLDIKVVSRDGAPLSIPKAFIRFLPLGMAWFLNNVQLPETVLMSFWSYGLSVAVFGLSLSIVYLFVFNRTTRQSLHDLLVGSYVVRASVTEPVNAQPTWPVHLAVCGLLVMGSAIAPYFTRNLAASDSFASLLSSYHAVSTPAWVGNAQVNKGQTVVAMVNKGQTKTTYLNIVAFSKDPDIDNTERARQLAKLALSADPSARQLDVIQVSIAYGYDIGIASSWRWRNHSHTPAEWFAP